VSNWARRLEEDLRWREGELASIKVSVLAADQGSVRQLALLRAMWTLLYAHYEGFCKYAWELYLEELGRLGLTRNDFIVPLARFSLEKGFRELRGDTSSESMWSFCSEGFNRMLNSPLEFGVELETESNLWPDLLKRNLGQIGLACGTIDEHYQKIRALVARRNDIAHGERMVIATVAEYQTYYDAAMLVMHELAVAVVDSLDKGTYSVSQK